MISPYTYLSTAETNDCLHRHGKENLTTKSKQKVCALKIWHQKEADLFFMVICRDWLTGFAVVEAYVPL